MPLSIVNSSEIEHKPCYVIYHLFANILSAYCAKRYDSW